MSMKHEVQIRALEERCSALESRLAAIEAELHRTSGEELVRTTGDDSAPEAVSPEQADKSAEAFHAMLAGPAEVLRRPGPGRPRYDVIFQGVTINTEALKYEDAEALASQQNQALEGLDTVN